jgi:hypothetical protein
VIGLNLLPWARRPKLSWRWTGSTLSLTAATGTAGRSWPATRGKQDFVYLPEADAYRCTAHPDGFKLKSKMLLFKTPEEAGAWVERTRISKNV